jgi:hypothetical protein
LSSDYFTNRQDRCVVVSGVPEFADAAHAVVRAMYASSVDNCEVVEGRAIQDRTEAFADFVTTAFGPGQASMPVAAVGPGDAVITPIAQFKHHRVRQDELVTQWMFRNAPAQARLSVATGYFNLPADHCEALLASPAACVHVLTAAPQANGFYSSAGASALDVCEVGDGKPYPRVYAVFGWVPQAFRARYRWDTPKSRNGSMKLLWLGAGVKP